MFKKITDLTLEEIQALTVEGVKRAKEAKQRAILKRKKEIETEKQELKNQFNNRVNDDTKYCLEKIKIAASKGRRKTKVELGTTLCEDIKKTTKEVIKRLSDFSPKLVIQTKEHDNYLDVYYGVTSQKKTWTEDHVILHFSW